MLLYVFTFLLLLNVLTQQASGEACMDLDSNEVCKALWENDMCLSEAQYAKEYCSETCFLCGDMNPSLLEQ
ncbi:hypothetical protein OESDEN_12779 [Oesophagostomum dentatum]|uniref:ShKT domain-containing protein n=1 Tax=Oesophagostomum dentatum TaxID=61180 RepID=A0A0B1SQ39_OESDE|nr:hypothetical protein OESDEN_12779 [Oesophagostomum dentatum]